jgi:hypothetical protein
MKNEEYYIESMMKEHLTCNKNGGRLNFRRYCLIKQVIEGKIEGKWKGRDTEV